MYNISIYQVSSEVTLLSVMHYKTKQLLFMFRPKQSKAESLWEAFVGESVCVELIVFIWGGWQGGLEQRVSSL